MATLPKISALPLNAERFADLETLFGAKGCSFARACWCMGYRIRGRPRPAEGVSIAQHNKAKLAALCDAPPSPGLIGYDEDETPVGWVAVAPRSAFERLESSPVMKPVDGKPVWSIVCFVVPLERRGEGIATSLLRCAIGHARRHGAPGIEAYPVDKRERSQPQWLWHGPKSMFDKAGFVEVARRKPERPVMRLDLDLHLGS